MSKILPTHQFLQLMLFLSSFLTPSVVYGQVDEKWARRYLETNDYYHDQPSAIAVDASGNVYVTGSSIGSGIHSDMATLKYDPDGVLVWERRFNGPGNRDDKGRAIAVDGAGNVYVTGVSVGNGTDRDYATIKYNSAGTLQWVQRYNGLVDGAEDPCAIAVDATGNVYVTGFSDQDAISVDYATVKYNSAGVFQWLRTYDGQVFGGDQPNAMTLDAAGNIYITGWSYANSSERDFATVKYFPNGNTDWIKRYSGVNSDDVAVDIAVDILGNIYVTGGGAGEGADTRDCITISYNSTGVERWTKRFTGLVNLSSNSPTSMALDASANVYVTGFSSIGSSRKIATVKYNSNGEFKWAEGFNTTVSTIGLVTAKVAVDVPGNIYVTGTVSGNNSQVFSSSAEDFVTIKYTAQGIQRWVKYFHGPDDADQLYTAQDIAEAIAVDANGNVYVTGKSRTLSTGDDYVTIKYAQCNIDCPDDITVNIVPGQCGAIVNYPAGTGTDLCGTLQYSPASGSFFLTGKTQVIIYSESGEEYCTFNVNVFDNVLPTLTACPADVTVYTGAGSTTCNQAATWTPPVGTDNCSATLTSTHTPGSLFPVGTTIVTYTVADLSTNSASCSFLVTVIDNTPPVITCPASQILPLVNNCAASLPDYSSLAAISDNCTPATSILISQLPAPGTMVIGKGTLTIMLEAKDAAGNISSCTFIVNKKDLTPPQIICPPDITVFARGGKCNAIVFKLKLGMATASDNCTGRITIERTGIPAENVFPVGVTTITYKATDIANNTSTCTQKITVVDNQQPVISSVHASPSRLWPADHTMKAITVNYKSSDNCSVSNCLLTVTSNEPVSGTGAGDLSPDWEIIDDHHVKLRAERSATGHGRTYTITITCKDAAGNITSSSTKVKVKHDDDDDDDNDRPAGALIVTTDPKKKVIENIEGLQAAASPNPTNNRFRIEIKSNNKEDKITMQVFDIMGRRVELRNNLQTGTSILVGDKYKQGAYFIRIMQGNEYKVIKLVKLSD